MALSEGVQKFTGQLLPDIVMQLKIGAAFWYQEPTVVSFLWILFSLHVLDENWKTFLNQGLGTKKWCKSWNLGSLAQITLITFGSPPATTHHDKFLKFTAKGQITDTPAPLVVNFCSTNCTIAKFHEIAKKKNPTSEKFPPKVNFLKNSNKLLIIVLFNEFLLNLWFYLKIYVPLKRKGFKKFT